MRGCGSKAVGNDTFVAIGTIDQRLTMLEHQLLIVAHWLAVDVIEGAVVEDYAILQDLDESRAFVRGGALSTCSKCGN